MKALILTISLIFSIQPISAQISVVKKGGNQGNSISVSNNADNKTLEGKTGSTIGIKTSIFHTASSYADLTAALSAMSGSGELRIDQTLSASLSSRDTIPSGVAIYFRQGAKLNVNKLLVFQTGSTIIAGAYPIFTGNLDSIKIQPGVVLEAYPEWFGGSNSFSIQYAVNAVSQKGVIKFLPGDYSITSTINISTDQDSLAFLGHPYTTYFVRSVDDTIFALNGTDKSNRLEKILIRGIKFAGDVTTYQTPYIYGQYIGKLRIEDFQFRNINGSALYLVQPWDVSITRGRFDGCGFDGDSTKAGMVIRSGVGDNANNIRISDVTWESPQGGHLSILGESGGGLDHGVYLSQVKFHGLPQSTPPPVSPFIYADSTNNISISQARIVWSPLNGPVIKAVKIVNFSIMQSDFEAQEIHPIFDVVSSNGITLISNSFHSSSGIVSDSLYGNLFSNQFVWTLNNILIKDGENFNPWNINNKWRSMSNDTTELRLLNLSQIDSSAAGNVLVIRPPDVNYNIMRWRSDGHILFQEGPGGTPAEIFGDASGRIIAYGGLNTGSGPLVGGGLVRLSGSFTGTDVTDTLIISGLNSNDSIVLTPRGANWNANDMLYYTTNGDTLFIRRNAGGTSNLAWKGIRIGVQ